MKLKTLAACALVGFSLPALAKLPYYPVQFPRDEGAHHANVPYPVNALTEWWYYNGKITSTKGRKLGYFVAAFHLIVPLDARDKARIKSTSETIEQSILMVQVMDIDKQKVYGKTFLYSQDDSSFSTDSLNIKFADDFSLKQAGDTYFVKDTAQTDDGTTLKFDLAMTGTRAPLLVGKTGLIDMWDDTNSYYYSNTRLQTMGTVQVGDEVFNIDPGASASWMDHQWGDFIPTPDKAQWIWSSAQLDNGMDISVFEMMDAQTGQPLWRLGNIIMPDNSRAYTTRVTITPSLARAGASTYPQTYRIAVAPLNLQMNLDAMTPDQSANGFWEGIHSVSGLYNGKVVKGFAFVENTVKYE